jgi:hypothetical protein
MNEVELYQSLTRFGDSYELNISGNTHTLQENLEQFKDDWKVYNPRKNIKREGLSITSLDGGLSGMPDLDSIVEYNRKNGTSLGEQDFNVKTPVYQYLSSWLNLFEQDLGRTHLIRLNPGGFFPIHRDNTSISIKTFRLLIPIANCNYPIMTFLLNRRQLTFNHGSVYFIDTCLEHLLFNAGIDVDSTFVVANVKLTPRSVNAVLRNLLAN